MPDPDHPRNTDDYTANLAGAIAIALGDEITMATDDEATGGGCGPAAIVRIATYPGQSVDFLSKALDLTHSATSRVVHRLVKAGLVKRRRPRQGTGDRRSAMLYLTETGESEYAGIIERRSTALDSALSVLSADERLSLRDISRKLLSHMARLRLPGNICRMCDVDTCQEEGCPTENMEGDASALSARAVAD